MLLIADTLSRCRRLPLPFFATLTPSRRFFAAAFRYARFALFDAMFTLRCRCRFFAVIFLRLLCLILPLLDDAPLRCHVIAFLRRC